MTDRWDDLDRAAEEATPGPWRATPKSRDGWSGVYPQRPAAAPVFLTNDIDLADARYIALASPDRIRELIAENRRLGEALLHVFDETANRPDIRAMVRAALGDDRSETDFAWLIERGPAMRHVPTVWWTGRSWVTDAWQAQRFASKAEAEAEIEARSPIPRHRDRFGVAVEHGFMDDAALGDDR